MPRVAFGTQARRRSPYRYRRPVIKSVHGHGASAQAGALQGEKRAMQAPQRRPRIRNSHLFAAAMVAGLWFIPLGTAQAASCTEHVLEAERELSIPRGLLLSIALVESGQDGSPQPFAMNLDGKSVYSENADEAKSHLLDSKGRVRQNATVGCMQLSVQHHRSNFRPVERILDPAANVWYAARYLKRLRADSGSWNV